MATNMGVTFNRSNYIYMNYKDTYTINTITAIKNNGCRALSFLERAGLRFLLFIVFLCLLSLGGGWGEAFSQDFRGALHIERCSFREDGDSLHLSFDIRVDSRAVPSCAMMVYEPEIRDSSDHALTLPYIQVNGVDRARLNKRFFDHQDDQWLAGYKTPCMLINVHEYTGESFTYSFSCPYEEWMETSRLILKQEVTICAGDQHLYTYTLAGELTLSYREPYTVKPIVAMVVPADEVKIRNRQGQAFLDFQVNRSVILPDFRRNPVELAKINDALVEVVGDMDSQITGMFVEGYASPEGSYKNNERLARERAAALKDYISSRYIMPSDLFTVTSIAEDWEGLKALVENSDLPQKERLMSIINSSDEPDNKERNLKKLTVYNRLLKDFFPDLRRVEYRVEYTVRDYSTTEAKELMNTNPANLSQAELYRVALEYGKDTPEYNRIIMEIIPKYNDNDPVALSNAAALLIGNDELNTARRLLERAQSLPAAWNNLGVVFLLKDELEKAENLFNQAALAGVQEAIYNLEELKKKREDIAKRERTNR